MADALQQTADRMQAKARATRSPAARAQARRLQARADLLRKAEKRLARWLRDNPGWHFLADACDGLEVNAGKASREPYSAAVKRLYARGVIERAGQTHTTRYRYKSVDTV